MISSHGEPVSPVDPQRSLNLVAHTMVYIQAFSVLKSRIYGDWGERYSVYSADRVETGKRAGLELQKFGH